LRIASGRNSARLSCLGFVEERFKESRPDSLFEFK
jgi:uncharacterized protein YbdZ (MbtH family)